MSTSEQFWIPPPGHRFRLIAYHSNKAIFSKNGVYHIRSEYKYNDEKCITTATGEDLELQQLNDTNEGLAEEYFSFAFEDTEVYKTEFNLENATTLGSSKTHAFEQKVVNGGSTDATMKLDLRRSQAVTGTFSRSHGFSISFGSKLKVKSIPWIGPEGEFELNADTSHQWTMGENTTWTTTIGFEVTTVVPPQKIGVGKGVFKESEMSVPVKIYSRSKSTGLDAITEAVYTGMAVWCFTYTIDHLPIGSRNG
ncbi:hypothetical protein VP1G_03657 [Cytospora mali]|uniref:Uncharacterized protein n=1 Tax=Cytospora mali TaxID=578113 RepID=A0A194UX12_CYTMA|nr:hypothetical protein VP1G_03657 [Valsa mali var. pyri (nom. inval.)]